MSIVVVVLGLGMSGCGGDPSPQEQCEDLVSMICDRAIKCIPGLGGQHDQCFDQLERLSGCAKIRSASASYDACVDRVESTTCGALFPNSGDTRINVLLPAECRGVVDLP